MHFWRVLGILVGGVLASAARADTHVVTADLPPFSIADHPDRPGFVVELAEAAFKRAGLPYRLEFLPWTRAQAVAKTEPDTIILGLTRTPDREADYQWVAEVLQPKVVFIAVQPGKPIDDIAAAKALPHITVRASTPFETLLKNENFTNVEAVQAEDINAKKLQAQRADAWLTYDLRGVFVWREIGGNPAQLVVGKPLSEEHLDIAASKQTKDETTSKIAAAVAALRSDGTWDALHKKYFGE